MRSEKAISVVTKEIKKIFYDEPSLDIIIETIALFNYLSLDKIEYTSLVSESAMKMMKKQLRHIDLQLSIVEQGLAVREELNNDKFDVLELIAVNYYWYKCLIEYPIFFKQLVVFNYILLDNQDRGHSVAF